MNQYVIDHIYVHGYLTIYLGLAVKIDVAVIRAARIGLDLPTEPTVGHIVGVVLSLANAALDPIATHGLVCEFKRKLKAKFKVPGFSGEQSLQTFPSSPVELPQPRIDAAYTDDKPTDYWKTHTLAMAGSHVPLRSSASSLRAPPAMSHMSQASGAGIQDLQSVVAQVVQGLFQMSPRHAPPTITLLKPNINHPPITTSPSQVLALADQPYTDTAGTPVEGDHVDVQTSEARQTISPPVSVKTSPLSLPAIPEIPPEKMSTTVLEALDARKKSRQDEKDQVDNKEKVSPKGKAAPKGKSAPKGKAAPTGKAVPKKAASSKPKVIKPAVKSKGGVKLNAKPPMPGPGSPTTYYLGGKVHRSELKQSWRVFIDAGDRVDKVFFLHLLFEDDC